MHFQRRGVQHSAACHALLPPQQNTMKWLQAATTGICCAVLQVACCEALLAAGFRPSVYPNVGFEARAPGDMEFIDRQVKPL